MNISEQQLNNLMAAVSVALQPLVRVVPMTAVEWADQYYYLPKESSYGDGEWKTLPFQIAIMNSMGNDQVRMFHLLGENCAVLAVKLVDKTKCTERLPMSI